VLGPQWATRSSSRKPGWASVHSAKVRTGISCVSHVPDRVVVAPRRGSVARNGARRAGQRGRADLTEGLVDGGGDPQVAAPGQPIEQLGEEGVPAAGPMWPAASESSWAAAPAAGP
jgi:hypothetical protein